MMSIKWNIDHTSKSQLGKKTRLSHAELREALGNSALPYQSVARWVEAFKYGHLAVVDLLCSGCPVSTHRVVQVAVVEQCLTEDRH